VSALQILALVRRERWMEISLAPESMAVKAFHSTTDPFSHRYGGEEQGRGEIVTLEEKVK
jgi:hypothetical protein